MSNPDLPDAPLGMVETGFAPIHFAARIPDVAGVKHALESRGNMKLASEHGRTPLQMAAAGAAGCRLISGAGRRGKALAELFRPNAPEILLESQRVPQERMEAAAWLSFR